MKTQVSEIFTLSLVFALIAVFLLLAQNAHQIGSKWGQTIEITAYLQEGVSGEESLPLQTELKAIQGVENVVFVSKGEAYTNFNQKMGRYLLESEAPKDLLDVIPETLQIKFSSQLGSQEIQERLLQTQEFLASQTHLVESFSFGEEWVKNYLTFMKTVFGVGSGIIVIMILCLVFVLYGALLSSYQKKQKEIEVLSLLGATRSFIHKPFYRDSIVISLSSAFLGLVLCTTFYIFVKTAVLKSLAWMPLADSITFLNLTSVSLLLGIALVVGLVATKVFVFRALYHLEKTPS